MTLIVSFNGKEILILCPFYAALVFAIVVYSRYRSGIHSWHKIFKSAPILKEMLFGAVLFKWLLSRIKRYYARLWLLYK